LPGWLNDEIDIYTRSKLQELQASGYSARQPECSNRSERLRKVKLRPTFRLRPRCGGKRTGKRDFDSGWRISVQHQSRRRYQCDNRAGRRTRKWRSDRSVHAGPREIASGSLLVSFFPCIYRRTDAEDQLWVERRGSGPTANSNTFTIKREGGRYEMEGGSRCIRLIPSGLAGSLHGRSSATGASNRARDPPFNAASKWPQVDRDV